MDGGAAGPKKHCPPHMRYLAKFGRFASKDVRINRGNTNNWGTLGFRLFGWGVADLLEIRHSPRYLSEFGRSGSSGTSAIKEIRLKVTSRVSPLKVT